MKKMIAGRKREKEEEEEERVDNFKISQNPTEGGRGGERKEKKRKKRNIMMMIKIWFRYTMNNEVLK